MDGVRLTAPVARASLNSWLTVRSTSPLACTIGVMSSVTPVRL